MSTTTESRLGYRTSPPTKRGTTVIAVFGDPDGCEIELIERK